MPERDSKKVKKLFLRIIIERVIASSEGAFEGNSMTWVRRQYEKSKKIYSHR